VTLGGVVSTVNVRVPVNDELALELSTPFARHQYWVAVWRLKPTGTVADPFWTHIQVRRRRVEGSERGRARAVGADLEGDLAEVERIRVGKACRERRRCRVDEDAVVRCRKGRSRRIGIRVRFGRALAAQGRRRIAAEVGDGGAGVAHRDRVEVMGASWSASRTMLPPTIETPSTASADPFSVAEKSEVASDPVTGSL